MALLIEHSQLLDAARREVDMIKPEQFDSVLVTVAHNWGDYEVTLAKWAKDGPGPRRFLQVTAARKVTGGVISLDETPPEYLNNRETRRLQRLWSVEVMGLEPTTSTLRRLIGRFSAMLSDA
jgi:hypothetical protein